MADEEPGDTQPHVSVVKTAGHWALFNVSRQTGPTYTPKMIESQKYN